MKRHTLKQRLHIAERARNMLLYGYFPHQIKRALHNEYGIAIKTADKYLRKARDWVIRDTFGSREDLRADSIAVYKRIVQDPDAKDSDKIKAQERVDKLMGLETPVIVRQHITGKVEHEHGGTIVVLERLAQNDPDIRGAIIDLARKVQGCLTPSAN